MLPSKGMNQRVEVKVETDFYIMEVCETPF